MPSENVNRQTVISRHLFRVVGCLQQALIKPVVVNINICTCEFW